MLNAVGQPGSVLVLGATSEIASATVAQLAAAGSLQRVVLAGRPSTGRDAVVQRVGTMVGPGCHVEVVDFDAMAVEASAEVVDSVFAAGDIDVVVLAFGVLPPDALPEDPVAAAAVVTTNFTGAVAALTVVGQRCRQQGHGTIVVLSSVAAERPRRSNVLYGATKAGLDAFATGLADTLEGSGVTVLVVRPGFVRTQMTAGLKAAPLAVGPEDVAAAIVGHLRGPSRTIWVPGALRPIMSVLRHLPRAVFRRLPI